jgi:flagellar hook-associated protein FlgK
LRTLDSLKGQLDFIEKTVKERLTDVPKELADKLAEQKKQVETLQNKLAQPETSGLSLSTAKSQLVEHIGGLFFTIDGTNGAPTVAMREQYDRVQTEFTQKLAEVNNYLSKTVPQLNEQLRRLDAPTLMMGKPIEMPKP